MGIALDRLQIVGVYMSESMKEAIKAEHDEVIRTLNEANDLLMKMFNVQTGDEE